MRQPNHTPFLRLAALLGLLVLLTLCVWPGHADFGDFSGDSDFGDSDWDWDDDDDSDSGWSWNSSRDDWDDGRDRDTRTKSNKGPSVLGILFIFACVIINLVIWAFHIHEGGSQSYSGYHSRYGSSSQESNANPDFDNRALWGFQLKSMDELPVNQPNSRWIDQLFREMQDCWGKGDISSLQKDFTADCYAQYARQLSGKIRRGETAHCYVESVDSAMQGWNEDEHEYMLAVEITAVITAWNTNAHDVIISGSKIHPKRMRYAWVLRRGREITAAEQRCPSCGCKLSLNYTAVCSHCGANVKRTGEGWALSSIQAISQKTL